MRLRGQPATPLTDAQRELVASHEHVARTITRQHMRRAGLDEATVNEICDDGLMQAARGYDPGFGTTFVEWAYDKTDLYARKEIGRERRRRQRIPFVQVTSEDGDSRDNEHRYRPELDWPFLAPPTPASADPESRELIVCVRRLMGRLPPRSAKAIRLRYFGHMSNRAVGAIFGVTDTRASQIIGDGLCRIRAMLNRRKRSHA